MATEELCREFERAIASFTDARGGHQEWQLTLDGTERLLPDFCAYVELAYPDVPMPEKLHAQLCTAAGAGRKPDDLTFGAGAAHLRHLYRLYIEERQRRWDETDR